MKFPNHVQRTRQDAGLSRERLAQAAGVTRQTIALIEAGKVCPSTVVAMRIARCLNTAVEALFQDPESVEVNWTGDAEGGTGGRFWMAQIGDAMVARAIPGGRAAWVRQAHVLRTSDGRAQWLTDSAASGRTVFLSGCDLGLGLVADAVRRKGNGIDSVWFEATNQAALRELAAGQTHVAAVHDGRPLSGSWSGHAGTGMGPTARRLRSFCFAAVQMGWMVRRGNPKGFTSAADLSSGRFALVNRPEGAGARRQLDRLLAESGVRPEQVPGYDREVPGHWAAAEAVQSGLADVAFGHAAAAAALGLSFFPVLAETYSLLIPEGYLEHPAVATLLELLHSDPVRWELRAAGPYDVTRMGREETLEDTTDDDKTI
ncbi:MAG: helix-turn-helix domain-containing protein [Alicyclobacillus sp.]|nr:helix-turn-helix domain-containing protein [Alicyclobacillus sp.]